MSTPLTCALAGFAAAPPPEDAADARDIAALSALDWVAVGIAGAAEPAARIVRNAAEADGGAGSASVFGGNALPARAAALVNGTASHALDYDDTHFAHIGHTSVGILPAALAVGEARGAQLAQVLDAALIGMEASVRIGLWLGRSHYQCGFHQTATAGAFGAALAAGRLMGLDANGLASTLGLVATQAAGLKAQFGTMGKPLNAGLAARSGVEAAQLVAAGFEPAQGALEGAFGFGATHHGAGDLEPALDGLGQRWLFSDVSHKFHACCHGLHAALEALGALDVAAPEIADVTVFTHPRWMSVCNQPAPMTGLGLKFSFSSVIAMSLLGYDTGALRSYGDVVAQDAGVGALRARVSVSEDSGLGEMQARLRIRRRDGAQLDGFHDLATAQTVQMRRARVQAKADLLIGPARAGAVAALLGVHEAGARDLGRCLRAHPSERADSNSPSA